jgi:hypothetical protein
MPTPAQVLATFQRQVRTALTNYDGLVASVAARPRRVAMERLLAEQCVLSIAVRWEAFIHDLILAYIEDRPDTCIAFHRRKVTQSVEAKHKGFGAWITVNVPNPLTRVQIEAMLDPEGRNVSAESADTLAQKANNLLAAAHARKFSLIAADGRFLDLVIAVRNYLSHRSSGSMAILRKRLAELNLADAGSPLNGAVNSVAVYLNARPVGADHCRAKLIGHSVIALAAKLV